MTAFVGAAAAAGSRRPSAAAAARCPPRTSAWTPAAAPASRRARRDVSGGGAPPRRLPSARFRAPDDADAAAPSTPAEGAGTSSPPPPPTPTDAASAGWGVDVARLSTSPEENLKGFIKTRGSLVPGEEFVFWWAGDIYGVPDSPHGGGGGGAAKHLFAFEGYNIGRMVPVEGGWRLLTREVGVYRDAKTKALLTSWVNPFTGDTCECVPVYNDPVNQEFLAHHPRRGPFQIPTTVGGGDVYWSAEIFLTYPSPLPRADFPDAAQSDVYSSLEMFQFFGKEAQLADATVPAAPDVQISWVRLGQWLPWMRMGDAPGRIVYHTRGRRLAGGYGDLPADLRSLVEAHDVKYASAPTAFSSPNETSWTYFRKWLAQKGGERVDGTVAGPEPAVAAVTGSLDEPPPAAAAAASADGHGGGASAPSSPSAATASPPAPTPGSVAAAGGRPPPVSADAARTYTRAQLRGASGGSPSAPLLVGLRGLVFDVSTARRHYGPGAPYAALTGRDATRALVTGELSGVEWPVGGGGPSPPPKRSIWRAGSPL